MSKDKNKIPAGPAPQPITAAAKSAAPPLVDMSLIPVLQPTDGVSPAAQSVPPTPEPKPAPVPSLMIDDPRYGGAVDAVIVDYRDFVEVMVKAKALRQAFPADDTGRPFTAILDLFIQFLGVTVYNVDQVIERVEEIEDDLDGSVAEVVTELLPKLKGVIDQSGLPPTLKADIGAMIATISLVLEGESDADEFELLDGIKARVDASAVPQATKELVTKVVTEIEECLEGEDEEDEE